MTIILRKFNYDYIDENALIFIIGMIGSGKSFLTKDILHHFQDLPIGTIISENNKVERNKYSYIPPIFIHEKYEKKILKNFIKREELLFNENNNYDTRSFLVFENCFYNYNMNKDKYFQKIITSNKKYNHLCIYETQKILKMNNNFKENIDYLFILKENVEQNRRKIYDEFKEYLGIEYSVFIKLMNDYTENNNFLVLNLKNKSIILEDKLFWYKAIEHKNFKMCSKECWDYNEKNYIIEPSDRQINRNIFY
jgi:hypothetical protein